MTTFFVGGCMRSGTTLLNSVLCSTDLTNPIIREAQYLGRLIHLHIYAQSTFDDFLFHYFDSRQDLKLYHAELIEKFLDRIRIRYDGPAHLVLKNPQMTPQFPEVFELVGDCKFLVVVRDPRDTICSIREVANRQASQGEVTDIVHMKDNLPRLAEYFLSYYQTLMTNKNLVFQKNLLIIRYEDLAQRTGEVVEKLAGFTGLPLHGYDPDGAWREMTAYHSEKTRNNPFYAELYDQPISSAKIGRHLMELTNEEIDSIERICHLFMQRCGYSMVRC